MSERGEGEQSAGPPAERLREQLEREFGEVPAESPSEPAEPEETHPAGTDPDEGDEGDEREPRS